MTDGRRRDGEGRALRSGAPAPGIRRVDGSGGRRRRARGGTGPRGAERVANGQATRRGAGPNLAIGRVTDGGRVRGAWTTPSVVVRAPDGSVVDPHGARGARQRRADVVGAGRGPGTVARRGDGAGGLVYGTPARDRARGRGNDRRRSPGGRDGATRPADHRPIMRRDVDRSIAPADATPAMRGARAPGARTVPTTPHGKSPQDGSPDRASGNGTAAGAVAPEETADRRPQSTSEGARPRASGPPLRSARGAPFAYGVVDGEGARSPSSPATARSGGRPAVRSVLGGAEATTGERGESTGQQPRLVQLVGSLHLSERLLPLDDEARELRSARVRKVGVGLGAVALAGVLVYAVFPVRTVLDQWDAKDRGREQLDVLTRENERLERRATELREPETIEEIARRDHGYVMPGEESYAVLPPPEGGDAPRAGDGG